MPEGDTVYRTAKNLSSALAGSVLTRCDVRVPRYATVDLAGQTVDSVASRGKHLLIRVGDSVIHSHLKMEGSWHLYRPGSRWRRPAFEARIVLGTAEWQAVGFALGLLEILPREQEDDVVGYLGPDLLGPDWDAAEAERRIRQQPERAIGLALLDQRNLAGVGNVYRNELCFLRGVLPTRPVAEVSDLSRIIDLAKRTLEANKNRVERTLTGDTRRGRQDWVYGRSGKPCRRCGTAIRGGTLGDPVKPGEGALDREIYWCPRCQS
ncbi:DNA-formamidopyrimidine glycosylase family protein [Amnibacterium sp. CER49]|uniref:DNA-formamidopyrimidine glycosylase family protein n=1 Tax=Amnibacterium sp. CER49 TaxID=3039161 RepID=UPI00244739B5|nr:DNA-formamidopyrimidine glycosylase family protein [Amnibacterium sp. CER49]MDH2443829.1 DNA-formamidopyrimidine glycosylase family protein [Amnibacterium sp. CER49]